MGQVSIKIGGRTYPVACKDGEEPRVEQLAEHVASKADSLQSQLGQMPEPRLLLLSAIMIADEFFELSEGGNGAAAAGTGKIEAQAAAALARAADRVEALAAALEKQGGAS